MNSIDSTTGAAEKTGADLAGADLVASDMEASISCSELSTGWASGVFDFPLSGLTASWAYYAARVDSVIFSSSTALAVSVLDMI